MTQEPPSLEQKPRDRRVSVFTVFIACTASTTCTVSTAFMVFTALTCVRQIRDWKNCPIQALPAIIALIPKDQPVLRRAPPPTARRLPASTSTSEATRRVQQHLNDRSAQPTRWRDTGRISASKHPWPNV